MNHISNSPRRTASIAAAVLLALGATSCGGGADASSPAAGAPATDAVATTTLAPTTIPATTVAPTTTLLIESTDELSVFAAEHAELVTNWSSELESFGDQAIDHLDDVSGVPGADIVATLSDEVVSTIGADATDPGLVTVRDFAAGISGALAQSVAGDQDGALTSFFALQAQSEQLTAAIALIEA